MTENPDGTITINIVRDFSKYPGGRYRSDGEWSGDRLCEDLVAPALRQHGRVIVELDGTLGYGSSVLEQCFGGLVRIEGFTAVRLHQALGMRTENARLVSTIWEYIDDAQAALDAGETALRGELGAGIETGKGNEKRDGCHSDSQN